MKHFMFEHEIDFQVRKYTSDGFNGRLCGVMARLQPQSKIVSLLFFNKYGYEIKKPWSLVCH